MRSPARTLLLLVLPLLLALPAAARAQADEPVGGPRLAGLDVVTDGPPLPPVTAASYVVADLDSGEVLAAKDPHGRFAPASTLKTLTALALLPRLDPASTVVPQREDVDVDGSKVGLVTELAYPVEDLFAALLMSSGNDAAGALATAAGGQDAAADLMNAEAERLQARDTRAVNTSGLDAEGQVSSAYDLALIARAAMAREDFRTLVATRRAFVPAPGGTTIEIGNHNRLLATYDGALGIKNGYTDAARASFVGAARRDGRTLVVTLMRGEPVVWREAGALLDWGFAAAAGGAEPVGQLVDPVTDDAPAAEAVQAAPPADDAQTVPVAAQEPDAAGPPLTLLAGGVLVLLLALVVLRRRAVVRARSRRRAAARRAAVEQSRGRPHLRAVPPR